MIVATVGCGGYSNDDLCDSLTDGTACDLVTHEQCIARLADDPRLDPDARYSELGVDASAADDPEPSCSLSLPLDDGTRVHVPLLPRDLGGLFDYGTASSPEPLST